MMCRISILLSFLLILVACTPVSSETSPTPQFEPRDDTPSPLPTTIEQVPTSESEPAPAAYMTFSVNVHDWVHVDESADTLLRLVDIFERYGVRGDFYFTAPIVEEYVEQRPDVIERLKNSDMTISYHVRPPHPLYEGFDQRLQGLDDVSLYATLLDYETYRLDLATGDLDRSRPGGYTYVAQIFGRKPVVAVSPNNDPSIKSVSQRVYADLGAQMTLLYHEEGTDMNRPFVFTNDLLVRPSDFSITRVTMDNGGENFWWNMMSGTHAEEFNPSHLLEVNLDDWNLMNPPRPPFITSLIHENNFYRSGAEAWTLIYFTDTEKTQPLSPPFNLDAPDASKPRSAQDQTAIWAAYEQMVAYAAAHLRAVTSADIVLLAPTIH